MSCLFFLNWFGRSGKVGPVEKIKNGENKADDNHPLEPKMLEGPEKGNSAQVAKKEGGITDGGEATADIGDDKDKENNVKACDSIAIHPNPRPDEEHGGASGSEDVGQKPTHEKKNHITKRGGFASNPDTDPPRNDEKGSDEGEKADVFFEGRDNRVAVSPNQEVVGDNNGGQGGTDKWVPAVPEGGDEQGTHGDGEDEDGKGGEEPKGGWGTHVHESEDHPSWMQRVNSRVKLG